MAAEHHHVLSKQPLNAEPPPDVLVSTFLTSNRDVYHRNHGEFVELDAKSYNLIVSSEADAVRLTKSDFALAELQQDFPKRDLVTVLSCAGNRRTEMDHEKEVEGLKWGTSAIANCHFAGAMLTDLLKSAGLELDKLPSPESLHIHFETSQNCEDDSYYAASLPLSIALDPERPTLLAYEMNHAPLEPAHGFPLRVVVPGVIGARSVKWLERIVIRDHESDNFYQARDYKVLPPEATPDTKAEYLKKTPALMEFPLNSVICSPAEGEMLSLDGEGAVTVKGYAVGTSGIRIESVQVAIVPLPVLSIRATDSNLLPEITSSEAYKIRAHASTLLASAWTKATLDEGAKEPGAITTANKHWGWTLFSAQIAVSDDVRQLGKPEVALIAYATDVEGHKQEMQTNWNLRGVAEASWSVVKCRFNSAVP